jgi:hypothetical protein
MRPIRQNTNLKKHLIEANVEKEGAIKLLKRADSVPEYTKEQY